MRERPEMMIAVKETLPKSNSKHLIRKLMKRGSMKF